MPERPEQDIVGAAKGRLVVPLLFLSPLVTSAAPRLTWLFLPLTAVALIVPYLRRGNDWRHLIWPTTDVVPVLLVAAYVLLGALWAVKPSAAVEKSALLLAVTLIAFAASRAIAAVDEPQLSQAARAFAVGAFIGALFVLFELLTDGAITRLVVNASSWFRPESAKHAKIAQRRSHRIQISGIPPEHRAAGFSSVAGSIGLERSRWPCAPGDMDRPLGRCDLDSHPSL